MSDFLWWRDGVIYQIYPRSFSDGNGDGLGDLPGIISHLDYLADLGVDAIWLSPIYPSPDKDFGYDISDTCDIDRRFGSLADFDQLVAGAHQRGLHVILDMVMNHTSDQHPWFAESRSSRDNPKRDWYIWRDHPNNWQASFGGKAWEYDAATGQYYLHLFTRQQPDVNWRNPQVRQAQMAAFRFWLERGVDGFRLDVFNAYFKHPSLPDNPPKFGLIGFNRQRHLYDIDQPEMMPLLHELRILLDAYPERFAVGETFLATPQKTFSYCGPDRLHAAFSFDFTSFDSELALAFQYYPWNPAWIMQKILLREKISQAATTWPTTVLSNHDLPRAASRYARGENDAHARIAMALLLTLRGTPFMYYGEEIGMRDIKLHRREILDPPGKHYWPLYKGRDGCRAPMQWSDGLYAGFSNSKSWLPVHPDAIHRNVASQQANPDSLLNFTKNLLRLRKKHPALQRGDFIPVESRRGVLAYLRTTNEQAVLVVMNFKGYEVNFKPPEGQWGMLFTSHTDRTGTAARLASHEVRLLIRAK
jgi:alpha-glucosidase